MDNTSILTFKAIVGFISDLNTEFGDKFKSIALYNRLLDKTGIDKTGPIFKHIECFRNFFNKNKAGMEEKKIELFEDTKISYSQNVYVDLSGVLSMASLDSQKIIWSHLLTIWGLIDPTSHAKRILHDNNSNGQDKESEFLSNILERVEKSVSDSSVDASNPMAAVGNLMNSGVFTDLINGMQNGLSDGSLDLGKLMGSVQGMMTKMGGGNGNGNNVQAPDLSGMMNMMSGMMGGMGGSGNSQAAPDLSGMMNMMSGMMGGMGGNSQAAPDMSGMMSMMSGMMSGMDNGNGSPPDLSAMMRGMGGMGGMGGSSSSSLVIEEEKKESKKDSKKK
jgi:hypothetical protein